MTEITINNERYQIWEEYSKKQLREIESLLNDVLDAAEEELTEVYLDGYLDGRFATGVVLEIEPAEVEEAFDEYLFIPEGEAN